MTDVLEFYKSHERKPAPPFDLVAAIIDDVMRLYEQGHAIKAGALIYLANPVDSRHARIKVMSGGHAQPVTTWQLHTAAGMVDITPDADHPLGSSTRMWRCACSALFADNSARTGECAACMRRRVTAAITSAPTNNASQQEFERVAALYNADVAAGGSWAEQAQAKRDRLAEKGFAGQGIPESVFGTRKPYAPLSAEESRELVSGLSGAIRTPYGPIKLKVDASMGPGEMRIEYLGASAYGQHRATGVIDPAPAAAVDRVHDEVVKHLAAPINRHTVPHPNETRPAYLKHGPGGLGGPGPCDASCRKCAAKLKERTPTLPASPAEWQAVLAAAGIDAPPPSSIWSAKESPTPSDPLGYQQSVPGWTRKNVDPFDVQHDGVTLRRLLEMDEGRRTEHIVGAIISPAQRAAVSAHWSAELRAKITAAKAAERNRVTITHEED